MKKGSTTGQFLTFLAMLIIAMLVLSTVFGKGIVANVIDFFGASNSKYLTEEFSLIATTAAYIPGDMKAGIRVDATRKLYLDNQYAHVMDMNKAFLRADNTINTTAAVGKGVFYVKKTGNTIKVSVEEIL